MELLAVIKRPLGSLGAKSISIVREMGGIGVFFFKGAFHMFSFPLQIGKILQQVYFIGVKSVLVICLTGAFTGMVLGLQGYYTLVKFGSEGFLGAAVSLTLIRELGPVFTAIMVTARAGSAIAAEIGIMRISEQIDALDTMSVNPIRFLFGPRLAASLISLPILTSIFDMIGILGGWITGCVLLGINPGIYFARIETSVNMVDINGGLVKSVVFAIVVATICCYQGYYTHLKSEYGAKGVSLSTTNAVVTSCVLILITDYILTSFLL